MKKPRGPFIHEDGEWMSIGFEGTNDTLLRMPEGWRDREVAQEWAEAVRRVLSGAEDEC